MRLKHRIIKISSTGDIVFFSEGDLEAMADVQKRDIEHILGRERQRITTAYSIDLLSPSMKLKRCQFYYVDGMQVTYLSHDMLEFLFASVAGGKLELVVKR